MKRAIILVIVVVVAACAREELPPPTDGVPLPTDAVLVDPPSPAATIPPPTPQAYPAAEPTATPEGYPGPGLTPTLAPTIEGYPPPEPTSSYPAPLESPAGPPAAVLTPEVLEVYPHDETAFTQGLVYHDGFLFESTGEYGRSTLREVDIESGAITRLVDLDPAFFGEGLAMVGELLYQLTWKEQVVIIYDHNTLEEVNRLTYEGEGWGLCFDGEALWMSSGSDRLTKRDPETFAVLGEIQVTQQGQSIPQLNELECVDGFILANVWFTDQIKVIDPETGRVSASINLFDLLPAEERSQLASSEVLNGIAYHPAEDVYFVTGKNWPKLFKVRFELPEISP